MSKVAIKGTEEREREGQDKTSKAKSQNDAVHNRQLALESISADRVDWVSMAESNIDEPETFSVANCQLGQSRLFWFDQI